MFRFTIRDVLWLMVVVGLACGWWIEHRWYGKLKRERDLAVKFANDIKNVLVGHGAMEREEATIGWTIGHQFPKAAGDEIKRLSDERLQRRSN